MSAAVRTQTSSVFLAVARKRSFTPELVSEVSSAPVPQRVYKKSKRCGGLAAAWVP
jgi:hypothetical protein